MLGFGERTKLPTILLIDDDLVSREVIATVLTLDGYEVHTAESGEAALGILTAAEYSPELVMMDAQLPGLSGVALIQQIRNRSKATIIAISGSSLPEDLQAAADGFLLKPFNPDALRTLLAAQAPAVPAAPAGLVVKPEILAQFRQLMPEATVKQIYTAVVTDLKKRHEALETAINAGNSAEIGRIGHAIKGGCGMAGAMEAADLGARLEAESDQLNNCRAALTHLTNAIDNLQGMLEQEFPG